VVPAQPINVTTIKAHPVKARAALLALLAAAFAALALASVWDTAEDPVVWTPDALYYQARLLEIRGVDHDAALERTFDGPLSAELRARDPNHTGNAAWVEYNEPFYERRVAFPLAGAALYDVAGNRSLLYLSLAGYVAAILALFTFLLLRFRVAIASLVTLGAVFLPPLVNHSSYPLTDSWGLALLIVSLTAAVLALDRGLRWLPLWIGALLILGFTRDSTWIPVLAAGWCAVRYRSRVPVTLFATGLAAALPPLLLYQVPVRELLAELVNNFEPSRDTSWPFILGHYPGAMLDLVRANVGFLRRGEWYTALYIVGGVVSLLLFVWRRPATRTPTTALMTAASVAALLYVFAAPAFSAFRLELVFLPMAAWGLALATEVVAARLAERQGTLARLPAASRRS
jgi:hypothetical protein